MMRQPWTRPGEAHHPPIQISRRGSHPDKLMQWVLKSPQLAKTSGPTFPSPLARSGSAATLDLRCYPKFSPLRSSYLDRTQALRSKVLSASSPGAKSTTSSVGVTGHAEDAFKLGSGLPPLPILLPHKLDWVQEACAC